MKWNVLCLSVYVTHCQQFEHNGQNFFFPPGTTVDSQNESCQAVIFLSCIDTQHNLPYIRL